MIDASAANGLAKAAFADWANEPARTDLPREMRGSSVYIPHITRESPYLTGPEGLNTPGLIFDPAWWLFLGPLDMVEIGQGPIYRLTRLERDLLCFRADLPKCMNADLAKRILKPVLASQGVCVGFEAVDAPEATMLFEYEAIEDERLWIAPAFRLSLRDRSTGAELDEQFKYFGREAGQKRNAKGPLATFGGGTEVGKLVASRYLKSGVFDNAIFRAALASPFARQAMLEIRDVRQPDERERGGGVRLLDEDSLAMLRDFASMEPTRNSKKNTLKAIAEQLLGQLDGTFR